MATDPGGQAPAPTAPRKSGGGVFTRKIGPFPAWVWMAIAAAGVLALVVYEYRKNSAGGSGTSSAATSPATPPTVFTFPPEAQPAGPKKDADGDTDNDTTKKKKPPPKKQPRPVKHHPPAGRPPGGHHRHKGMQMHPGAAAESG